MSSTPAGSTAFVGATIVDVVQERCISGQAVVVDGGRIAGVRPAEQVVGGRARIRDVQGSWILPGLIDMHCHLTGHPPEHVPVELFLANGVTTVRDPGGRVSEQRLLRDLVRSGRRRGPRILIAGELLDGNPPVWPSMAIMVDTPARGSAAVRHLAAQGVDCIKIYNHVSAEVLAEIVAVAGELGLPVIGHVPRRMSMRQAVEAGMRCLEHIRITGGDFLDAPRAASVDLLPVSEREPRLWELIQLDDPWVEALIDLLAKEGVTLDPTLLIDDVLYGEGLDGPNDHPDNAHVDDDTRRHWASEEVPGIMRARPELQALARSGMAKQREFVRRCWTAGVRITAGTDGAGLGRLLPGFGVHHEIALLRSSGLTPFAALRAATIDAADALGLATEIGSLTAGKAADFAVWSADPLSAHLRPDDLVAVVVAGEVLPHAATIARGT